MGSTLDRNQQKSQSPFFNNGIRESHEEGRHPLSSSLSLRFDRRNWTKIPANISSGHLIDLWAPFGSGERKGTDGRLFIQKSMGLSLPLSLLLWGLAFPSSLPYQRGAAVASSNEMGLKCIPKIGNSCIPRTPYRSHLVHFWTLDISSKFSMITLQQ